MYVRICFWLHICVCVVMLYTHDNYNDINHNSTYTNVDTGKYKYKSRRKKAGSVVQVRTVYLFLNSVLRYAESDTIPTMLTIPNAWRILWCLRSPSLEIRKSQLHLQRLKFNCCLDGKNSTVCLHGPISIFNWLFKKILKFSGPSLPQMTLSALQPHFPSEGLLGKLHPMTMPWIKRFE